ncbi:MAG: hypothetical protein JRI59_05980 [Deltaproteobacteria bacterium]|nr:hypothetical protein [Deltaproteobacteria bacterium]
MKWGERLQYAAAAAGLAAALWLGAGAAGTVRVLKPGDCRVMEEHLQGQGYRVKVVSGSLVMAGGELVAVLNVVLPDGRPAEVSCSLGPLRDGAEYVRSLK